MRNQLFIWPARWSFLVDEYKKMYDALEGRCPLSPIDPKKSFPVRRTKTHTYLPPIHPEPAPLHLPRTSSGMYGYTPLKDGRNLVQDRQNWTRPSGDVVQHDLIKVLKWPMDYYD
ncbi:hypothetical protein ACOMHN_038124 [Nucella lapillus]